MVRTALMGGPFICRTGVLELRNMSVQEPGEQRVNTATVVVAAVCFVTVVGAGAGLAYSGMETGAVVGLLTGLVGIVTTMIAVLDKLTNIQRVNVVQDLKLDEVKEQTNGSLRTTMREEVEAALSARFGSTPAESANIVQPPKSNGE